MEKSRNMVGTSFFDTSGFLNAIHANNIAIWVYLANTFFSGDMDRVIYASTAFAFRERSSKQENNNLNLPFANFRIDNGGIKPDTNRRWRNHSLAVDGQYVPEIKDKIKMFPVTIDYDSTFYVEKEIDYHYISSELFWRAAGLETVLSPEIEYTNSNNETFTLPFTAIVDFNLDLDVEYNEKDWLEQNHIRALKLDMSVQTWLLKSNSTGWCIPKEVIFGIAQNSSSIDSTLPYGEVYAAVINHVNEEVEDFIKQD